MLSIVTFLLLMQQASIDGLSLSEACQGIQYDDWNDITPKPISLRRLAGSVVLAPDSIPLRGVCLGLFSEPRQSLKIARADDDGNFDFGKIKAGNYRIVVALPLETPNRVEYLFFANVPVRVVKWPRGGFWSERRITLIMILTAALGTESKAWSYKFQ